MEWISIENALLKWGTKTIIWTWNPETDEITLNEKDCIIGEFSIEKNTFSFEECIDFVHPLDKCQLDRKSILDTLMNKNYFKAEIRLKNSSDLWFWVMVKAKKSDTSPIIEGIIQDIHSFKEIQFNLLEEEFKFKALFENSPIATWLEDLTGLEDFLNEMVQKNITNLQLYFEQYPYKLIELIGKIIVLDVNESAVIQNKANSKVELIDSIKNAFSTEALNDFINELEQMLKGENIIEYVSNSLRQDGSPLIVLVRIYIPINDGKRDFSKVIVTGTDITQSKLDEIELRKAKEKAEENDKLKSAFLSNISHEIRTPINGIIGLSEIIKMNDNLSVKNLDYLDEIHRQAYKLLNIVEDIVEISKLESGNAFPVFTEMDLRSFYHSMHEKFSVIAGEKGLRFSGVYRSENENLLIISDEKILNKILSRLISNAIKFTSKGFVHFDIIVDKDEINFKVTDSGIGIESHNQEIIFEPFRQLDYGYSRSYEGTGMGLAICQKYACILEGNISLLSQFTKGSEFTLKMPLKK